MKHSITLTVNGQRQSLALTDPRTTLLDLLRETLGLTGAKKACDRGQCVACTVMVNGQRVVSCLKLAAGCDQSKLLTIEGVGSTEKLHPLQ